MRRARLARAGRIASAWTVALLAVALLTVSAGRGDAGGALVDEDLRRGGELYALHCAACHGGDGRGGSGSGLRRGPPVDDADVALVDLVIRTGRMPIVAREAGMTRDPRLDGSDRERIVAWMTSEFELPGRVPEVPEGDPGRGRLLFNEHCAACHSTTGWGGVAGGDVMPPSLRGLDRVALVSAARVGPFEMPILPEVVVSDAQLADIATAVEQLERERPSPLAFLDLNHASGTLFSLGAIALLVGFVVVASRLPVITVAEVEEGRPEGPEEPGIEEELP